MSFLGVQWIAGDGIDLRARMATPDALDNGRDGGLISEVSVANGAAEQPDLDGSILVHTFFQLSIGPNRGNAGLDFRRRGEPTQEYPPSSGRTLRLMLLFLSSSLVSVTTLATCMSD